MKSTINTIQSKIQNMNSKKIMNGLTDLAIITGMTALGHEAAKNAKSTDDKVICYAVGFTSGVGLATTKDVIGSKLMAAGKKVKTMATKANEPKPEVTVETKVDEDKAEVDVVAAEAEKVEDTKIETTEEKVEKT